MESWAAPELPRLPGPGLQPRVWDTSTSSLQLPVTGREAGMYVCGITPYDATHMGHAATYVAFDLLNRAWRDAGLDVRSVQNVTDVDDPLLERAHRDGEDWAALAERETALFREDMAALRVLPPDHFVGAVEAIPEIVSLIEVLREKGAAYDVDGDLYFPVSADPRFGEVPGLGTPAMLALFGERGGDPDRAGKKDPLDCLLWRAERPGEPAWDSAFGRGRPGWHVECTTIALEHLDRPFAVQGGGSDLAFPHHQMSASHAYAATGEWPFARAYVHTGMVGLDGAKMSKSKGNLVLVSALRREGADPMALRLALLAHRYRADWDWTAAALEEATGRLGRWRAAVNAPAGPPGGDALAAVRRRLADDLDAPGALAALDRWAAAALAGTWNPAQGGPDPDAPALVRAAVDGLLGVRL